MKRLAHHTISGLRGIFDLQGRATLQEYGFLVTGTAISVILTFLIWAFLGFWAWPLMIVNAVMILACLSAGVRRLRDAGQHLGWAIAHGISLILILAAYGLLLADINPPQLGMQPGWVGAITFVLLLVLTVAGLAVLQAVMLLPVAVFIITTPIMVHLARKPSLASPGAEDLTDETGA